MKKRHLLPILIALIALLLFPSCHFSSIDNVEVFPEGCFDKVTEIKDTNGNPYPKTGHLQFIVLTDVHVGRENNDPGVYRNHENFYKFYNSLVSKSENAEEGKDMPILLLGDICDSGRKGYYDLVDDFLDEIRSQRLNEDGSKKDTHPMPILMVPGNHEFMDSDLRTWNMYFGNKQEEGLYGLGSYSIGNILFENTNSAYRIYTKAQLDAIEYNLKKYGSDYRYKFFLSHIPLASEKFDQSLFWYIMADADERNEMLRLMYIYGPSFNLVGHLHEGAQFNEYTEKTKEFIFSSFHKRNVNRDNGGLWHIVDIDQGTESEAGGDVTIYAFDIDTEGITKDNYAKKATATTRFNMNTVTK